MSMTEKQQRRVDAFRRRVSVKGAVEIEARGSEYLYGDPNCVSIGWERPRDGRDMETVIDSSGRTVKTEPVYRYR